MSEKVDIQALDSSLFERIDRTNIHDQAFETKPVSYLRDCWRRFRKNKGSVVAAIIILIIALYAIIVPLASPKSYVSGYPNGYYDTFYSNVLPANPLFRGTGFWDGTFTDTLNETAYRLATYTDANKPQIVELIEVKETLLPGSSTPSYSYVVKIDDYARGIRSMELSASNFEKLMAYEAEQGIAGVEGESILKPLIDYRSYVNEYYAELLENPDVTASLAYNIQQSMLSYYNFNPTIYYELSAYNESTQTYQSTIFYPVLDEEGDPVDVYQRDDNGDYVYYKYNNGRYSVRVDYFDYYTWNLGFEPYLLFGGNSQGQDLFLRLAEGARFSLLIGVVVSAINFLIGLVWGAVSGYYGGTVDLVMERITDIIGNIPSVIILTICSVAFTSGSSNIVDTIGSSGSIIVAFLIAFVYSGWIGTASTTRMQFYRFKGQEYVLASRTLGAKDRRLIFRHILPNAAGTLVTSSVLMIPGIIFSETSLSYLGIIDFSTSGLVSIGSLLEEGQATLNTYPHLLLFPCLIIALLMICFNLFGNGLRDAFNTTLKGAEE